MYKRASQIENILRKEKEREKGIIPEKRKEGADQASRTPAGSYQKKAINFGNFKKVGLGQMRALREKLSLRSNYWFEMAIRGIISVEGARITIWEKIVTEIWLSVIFVTKEAIESMNAT